MINSQPVQSDKIVGNAPISIFGINISIYMNPYTQFPVPLVQEHSKGLKIFGENLHGWLTRLVVPRDNIMGEYVNIMVVMLWLLASLGHQQPWFWLYNQADPCFPWGRLSTTWGTFHKQFFHRNSNTMEIWFCSHQRCNEAIAMKFCTCHDSYAVVGWAKFCSDMILHNGVTLKPISHQIQFTIGKSSMKWAL